MPTPAKNPVRTRILVLEEHPLLRHGIIDYLNSQPDMIVSGEADNIRDAGHKIQESKPQLLLTALRLGTGDSLEFLKALKSERPALLILVYSAFEETIFAERAFRAGADGYIMKKAPKEELLSAIREIMSGNIYVRPELQPRSGSVRQEIRGSHFRAADGRHRSRQKEGRPLPRRLRAIQLRIDANGFASVNRYNVQPLDQVHREPRLRGSHGSHGF
jgi:DNA-binding NarL/FixJ family response regulator